MEPGANSPRWQHITRCATIILLNRKGKVLKASIPGSWLEAKLQNTGYSGKEYEEIWRQLDNYGKAEVVLNLGTRRVWWVS